MPRYFFDVKDGPTERRDEVGEELEGLNAARNAATKLSSELLAAFPDRFWSVGEWNVTVRDETGLILFVLHFFAVKGAAALD
jgi:hypothetical protein